MMPSTQQKGSTKFHLQSTETILNNLKTTKNGLQQPEVNSRLAKFGRNELVEEKREPKWQKFLRQFYDVLIIVLLIAAIITAVLKPYDIDWIVISAIVLITAIIGYLQEAKAEEAIERLKKLAAPHAIAFRSGKRQEVEAAELVPGDVIYLESGMKVPADGRVIESFNFKVNESALTGESVPVHKISDPLPNDVPLAERTNMLFMSTIVETGRGKAVISATGMDTEIGHIAEMIQKVKREETPLQKRLKSLGKRLGGLFLGACIIIFVLELIRELGALDIDQIIELFETSVSLAVAAIPEGLPAVVTIGLAIGIKAMAKKRVIIRKLPVVETLGSATVICTDKTGTLTTGTMTADLLFINEKKYNIEGAGYKPEGCFECQGDMVETFRDNESIKQIMLASVLCSDAELTYSDKQWNILGDTTEGALIVMAEKAGFHHKKNRKKYPRLDERAFDSSRKMMSTVNKIDLGTIVYTKGAPESILEFSTHELWEDKEKPLTDSRKSELQDITSELAGKGYRTLAFAYNKNNEIEQNMVFLGLVGIRDKTRIEAKDAVKTTQKAGIRVIMITGDHKLTATAVGKEIGVINTDKQAINCEQLDSLDDTELKILLQKVSVFARASPEHKVRIVSALKTQGEIVAMTGDGVNDAPALKLADIGVAMGITGTDVSKEASDMIITDDNFASIVAAVEEGRGIYDNIRKVIQFLLSCNVSEITLMLVAILLNWPLPLVALQILWMNLVTDSFPALALNIEPKEPDLMSRKPRDPKEKAITRDMVISILISAVIITMGSLFMFWYSLPRGLTHARTMALTTMIMFQMWTAIACRSTTHTMSEIGWFSNPKLLGAIALSIVLMLPIIYLPQAQAVFETTALGLVEWFEIIVISVLGLVVIEVWEWVNRRYFHYGVAG
jgi:Ca2+-transporting ATPase